MKMLPIHTAQWNEVCPGRIKNNAVFDNRVGNTIDIDHSPAALYINNFRFTVPVHRHTRKIQRNRAMDKYYRKNPYHSVFSFPS